MKYNTEAPKYLNKYRDWNNPFHRRMLTHFEIFSASPDTLNDPLDCNIPIDWSLVTKENLLKYLKSSELELKENSFILEDGSLNISKINRLYPYPAIEEIRKKWGVISLSEDALNPLLWSHYAASHTGFCVKFDVAKLCKDFMSFKVWQVSYKTSYPKINPITNDHLNSLITRLTTKSSHWSYEKEWRFIWSNLPGGRATNFSASSIVSVMLGLGMDKGAEEEVISAIASAQNGKHIKIYKVSPKHKSFELKVNRIK